MSDSSFKIKSALKRSVQLSDLVIQHPVVNVRIDQNGSSNLPVPPASASNSHTSVFDLAVEHFQLTNGTILYNDQATPVQADINDLQVESRFDSLRTRCDASISYDKGNVQYGRYAPFAHAFRTRLNANTSFVSDRVRRADGWEFRCRVSRTGFQLQQSGGHGDL